MAKRYSRRAGIPSYTRRQALGKNAPSTGRDSLAIFRLRFSVAPTRVMRPISRIWRRAVRSFAVIRANTVTISSGPIRSNPILRASRKPSTCYDVLGREYQIAHEARDYYDDARGNVGKHDGFVYRGLNVAKYLFWEQRDAMLGLEPLVRAAWEYEDRPSHEESVLERYRVAADLAIARADRIQDVTYADYVAKKTLPSFDDALGLKRAP